MQSAARRFVQDRWMKCGGLYAVVLDALVESRPLQVVASKSIEYREEKRGVDGRRKKKATSFYEVARARQRQSRRQIQLKSPPLQGRRSSSPPLRGLEGSSPSVPSFKGYLRRRSSTPPLPDLSSEPHQVTLPRPDFVTNIVCPPSRFCDEYCLSRSVPMLLVLKFLPLIFRHCMCPPVTVFSSSRRRASSPPLYAFH
ncbi:hypothetical protein ACLOJK_040764 [Asimina triloba]